MIFFWNSAISHTLYVYTYKWKSRWMKNCVWCFFCGLICRRFMNLARFYCFEKDIFSLLESYLISEINLLRNWLKMFSLKKFKHQIVQSYVTKSYIKLSRAFFHENYKTGTKKEPLKIDLTVHSLRIFALSSSTTKENWSTKETWREKKKLNFGWNLFTATSNIKLVSFFLVFSSLPKTPIHMENRYRAENYRIT